ncbi:GNAT family N-acetyltransferase [Corynebacterium mastitidis]|uniref:GNAT family N-acetyltransferase n=1 Tax=Corynebacterium mastitidis TaxID=161890 RepID=UPI00037B1BFF|nr:GNAT family N-acetyltransferase [Corynebacterium mastitidis]
MRLLRSPLEEMEPATLYRVLKLRADAFVVEQRCPFPELDGRDLEPGALHLWAADGERVAAALRVLREPTALRIGRVVAHPDHRGSGVARRLFSFGVDTCRELDPGAPVVLDAQAPLTRWYGSFGFRPAGPEYVEDGIPHVPMRLEPRPAP